MAKFLDKTGLDTFWAKIKSLVTSSIQALDVSSVGGAGKYISAIFETDGKISATATTMDTTPTASSTNAVTSGGVKTALDGKVDKETGKGLSTNDYTTTEKNKLAGIASGAEVNVQSDWNQTTTTADDYIKNKPTIPSGAQLVYDCGTGSTSTTDFDNALAAFNAGRWVIIHQYTNVYYCVGTYNSGLRFKRLTNDTTILKVDTLNWTRGSAPAAGTALEAALVGHTHSNYVPTSRKINGKTLDEDITLTSTDVAAASVGPSNSSKDWIELGTFQYNDSNVMYAGLTLAVQFRANDGRNESGILWISTGEYKASGGYSNADVVASFSTVSRRSATKTERFALYFNALGTTSTSGAKLYAKVQGYSSVYVTPINAVKGSWVPSMTFLDSEPATKVEVTNYTLLKSTPGSGIGSPSSPVYVDAYGQVIPCNGITVSSDFVSDAYAASRIVRRQTYVFTPIGWTIGSSTSTAYDNARHMTLASCGNFYGCDLRICVYRINGNFDFSLRGYTTQNANNWLAGASVYHCGKVVVRSANTTETSTRIYSAFDTIGANSNPLFILCDPSFPSSTYTQYGTWEGSMIIDPNTVGGKDVHIEFNMVFRIESSDNSKILMGGRVHVEAEDDVQFVYS